MSRLHILVLGPDCNPEKVSIRFVTYCHAAALGAIHDVTLAAKSSVEDALRRANPPFRAIEVIRTPWLDRVFAWGFRYIFKNNYDSQALTAFRYPFAIAFEWRAWRQLRRRIRAGEFDVVLRLVPLTAVLPSPFARFLRKGPVPFVIGPISGGLPWPPGFSQLKKQREWVSGLRNLYRYLPFARSTYRHAAAIIAASSHTYSEFGKYRERLFFVTENAVDNSVFRSVTRKKESGAELELIFVGGLHPRKACDMALRGAAFLLKNKLARFTIVGDGPEENYLRELTRSLNIEEAVSFCGWVSHAEVLTRLRSSDVLVFPSVRDFGGGVIFEALAVGAVPVVVDFGGPGDIVNSDIGYKIPLTNENEVVLEIERILKELCENRELLHRLKQHGMSYAQERLTWGAKAQSTSKILEWVVQGGPKPDFAPSTIGRLEGTSLS